MKPITVIISENDIRFQIEEAASEMEKENQIQFPDDDSRAEFIEDCVSSVIDKYELYDRDPFEYRPSYHDLVLDIAKLYGYIL